LKPGPARRVGPGLELGRVEKKIEKVMTWCDPVDWLGKTRSKTGLQPVDFFLVFYENDAVLNFFKIGIDPANLVTRSKPGTRVLDRAGHLAGFKNYGFTTF
jgi:hypothetical protein